MKNFRFDNKKIIIAEIGNTHEGNFHEAKLLIYEIKKSGAHGVKFQKFTAEELVKRESKNFDFYKKLEMSDSEWNKIVKIAKKEKLYVFFDVFGIQSAKFVSKLNIDGYKLHSSDLTNPELLRFMKNERKTILISSAGSTMNELENAI